MKCFCSASSVGCPHDKQKECQPGIEHCFLTLKWSREVGSYVETVQDCWLWSDKHNCPNEYGPCHVLQESEKGTKTCCCKGELCNNATDIQFVVPPDPSPEQNNAFSYPSDASGFTLPQPSPYPELHRPVYWILPLTSCILFILLLIMLFSIYRSRMNSIRFKRPFRIFNLKRFRPASTANREQFGDVLNEMQPLNGIMTDSMKVPTLTTGWLAENEVEGLGSKVTKLELKSQGCFGQVWHGRLTQPIDKLNGITDVAVKIFQVAQKDSWDAELALFRSSDLAHPNILKYYGADQVLSGNPESPESTEFWIITEYHPLGSLHDYLMKHTISWPELLKIAIGMARGLSHLHSETVTFNGPSGDGLRRVKPSIAHRDLNSRNVLLKSDLTACIADFGLAIRFEPGQLPSVAHPQLGTRRYMAPEVLDGAIQFSRDAYLRIDVYAMGLVFWELMSRCYGTDDQRLSLTSPYMAPFQLELGPTPTIADLERYVTQERQRPKFNPLWADFQSMCVLWETVEECWDQDAEARLSAGCVTERISSLSRQPWSGRIRPNHNQVHTHPYPTTTAPVQVTTTTTRISAPFTHRTMAPSPISFPVPSTSVPIVVACQERLPESAMLPPSCLSRHEFSENSFSSSS